MPDGIRGAWRACCSRAPKPADGVENRRRSSHTRAGCTGCGTFFCGERRRAAARARACRSVPRLLRARRRRRLDVRRGRDPRDSAHNGFGKVDRHQRRQRAIRADGRARSPSRARGLAAYRRAQHSRGPASPEHVTRPAPFEHMRVARQNVALATMFGGQSATRRRDARRRAMTLARVSRPARQGCQRPDDLRHGTERQFLELARAPHRARVWCARRGALCGLTTSEIDRTRSR